MTDGQCAIIRLHVITADGRVETRFLKPLECGLGSILHPARLHPGRFLEEKYISGDFSATTLRGLLSRPQCDQSARIQHNPLENSDYTIGKTSFLANGNRPGDLMSIADGAVWCVWYV
jgi:hypothetical protein